MNNILVIGDSWASAIESDIGVDGVGWPAIMGIDPQYRLAVAGSTAVQWASDYSAWLTRAKACMTDTVVISLLGNDAIQALADGVLSGEEVADGLAAMHSVVQAIQRKRTIVMLYADPFSGADARARIGVPMLNAAIQLVCSPLGVIFADTSKWLNSDHFLPPNIHPTRAGHEIIASHMLTLCTP